MPEELLKRPAKPGSPFLVFTSAGKHAQVEHWLRGKKGFDLWVTSYAGGIDSLREAADYFNEREGGKFPNFYYVFQEWRDIFDQYEAVFVMDDDLVISGSSITELFNVLQKYDLYVLQPAFSQLGKLSHNVTIARLWSYLRFTNFVEVTCPLFRADKLAEFMSVYDPALVCWGVDYWYMQHLVGDRPDKAAVVDAITAVNPYDETKGGREIDRLITRDDRIAAWSDTMQTKQLYEVDPLKSWSLLRRFGSIRFYTGSFQTFLAKAIVRIRTIFGIDPSQRMERF